MHRTNSVRYDNWSVNQYMLETARLHAASTSASTARISRHVCHAQGAFLTEGSDFVGSVARGSGGASAGPRSDAARPVQSKKRARESKTDSKVALHESLAVAAGGALHGNTQSAPAGVNTRVSTGSPEPQSSLTLLLNSLSAQNVVILARIQACEEATAAAIAAATQVTAVATAIVSTAAAAVAASTEATAAATTATAELHTALDSMTAIMNGFGMVRGAVAQSNATQVRVVMHEHIASTHTQEQDEIQVGLSAGPSERTFPVPPRESSDGRRDLGGASK